MINTIRNYFKKRNQFIDIRRINFKVEHYAPKPNKFKQVALLGVVGLLLATPLTNWALIPFMKILNKYPLWVYR